MDRRETALAAGAVLVLTSALASLGLGAPEAAAFRALYDLPTPLGWVLLAAMPLGSGLAAVVLPLLAGVAGMRRTAVGLAVGAPGAWLLAQVVKRVVARPRPSLLLDVPALSHADGFGFPSGHTAVAVALAVVLWPALGGRGRVPVAVAVVAVAVARLHVGVHLPLDLVGGAAVGVLGGLAGRRVQGRLGWRSR